MGWRFFLSIRPLENCRQIRSVRTLCKNRFFWDLQSKKDEMQKSSWSPYFFRFLVKNTFLNQDLFGPVLKCPPRKSWKSDSTRLHILQSDSWARMNQLELKYSKEILNNYYHKYNHDNNFGHSGLSTWKYKFSYDHWSQAMLSSVSTWMGDCSKSRLSVAANP